jgi:hypothetical protein
LRLLLLIIAAATLANCTHYAVPSDPVDAGTARTTTPPTSSPNSPTGNLRTAYTRCVDQAFDFTHLKEFVRDGNLLGAIERSFADCRTEEEAIYSTAALALSLSPPDEAAALSRAFVANLKARIKSRIMRDFAK